MVLCGLPQKRIASSCVNEPDYPKIHLNVDRLNISNIADASLNSSASWRNVIIPVEESACKRIVRTFFENGLRDAISEAGSLETGETLPIVCNVAQLLMKGIMYIDMVRNQIFKTSFTGIKAVAEFSETRDWIRSPVRYIAWHPHCFKMAVAGVDDQIRVCTDIDNQIIIKNTKQKSISCMAWRPFSAGDLAVGCCNGVLIWTIDVANHIMRPSSNYVALKNVDFAPVSSIQWNKDGNLLAVASLSNSDVLVWNYDKMESTILRRIKLNCSLLKWSPDDSCLLSTTTSNVFRVWYTENKWTPERWFIVQGVVQSACWSPCSSALLFVTSKDSLLYCLHFNEDQMFSGESSQMATPIADLSKIVMNGQEVGGYPQALAWDPNGVYLAISFKDSDCVVIYTTYLKSFNCNITPICYIVGIDNEYPSCICFQSKNRCNSDSILTIGWSTGRIQHIPLYHLPEF